MTQQATIALQPDEMQILDWEHGPRLNEVIAAGISDCDRLDILVGFFFFDGIQQVREALRQNPNIRLRVLVGMSAGIDSKGLIERAQRYEAGIDDEAIAEDYRRQVKEVVAGLGSENDTWGSRQAARLYADLINQGRLLIRQTRQPNHSKLYIFNQKQPEASFYLVGSSNFSRAGIAERQELNVRIRRTGLEQVHGLFDSLWDEAVCVTDFKEFSGAPPAGDDPTRKPTSDPLAKVLKEESPFRDVSPYDLQIWLMLQYLKLKPERQDDRVRRIIEATGFKSFSYQIDAVHQALTILDKTGGVLIADVVGLGKSVVGSAIAACDARSGIVLCPPHLTDDWADYLVTFHLDEWAVFSMYQLQDVREYLEKHPTQMVIVDEAHRFRNPETEGYAGLHGICKPRKVVLLTATPFNNRPRDIGALLKLFRDAPVLGGDAALKELFDQLDKDFDTALKLKKTVPSHAEGVRDLDRIGSEINRVLQGVMVRRNRLDLLSNDRYRAEVADSMAEQQPPVPQLYQLDKEQDAFFDRILTEDFGGTEPNFHGAMYRPERYLEGSEQVTTDQAQENLYGFVCRSLVNRFESSFAAFKESITSVRKLAVDALENFERNDSFVLDRKQLEAAIAEADDDEAHASAPGGRAEHGYPAAAFRDPEAFKAAIRKDILVLDEVLREIERLHLIERDPKLEALTNSISQVLLNLHHKVERDPNTVLRKVVVFTVFADTAEHIRRGLEERFGKERVAFMTGDTKTRKSVEAIKRHFDARNAPVADSPWILVTTDALSEGVNLNQAGLVINYDIPWNPTRVIQRIGRINRINKKVFDKIYVFNFFPTKKGEDVIHKTMIAGQKMQMIHRIVCEDAQVLDASEDPQPAELFNRVNHEALDQFENRGRSVYTQVLQRFEECRDAYSSRYGSVAWDSKLRELEGLPERLKTVARFNGDGGRRRLTIFRHDGYRLDAVARDLQPPDPAPQPLGLLDAFAQLESQPETPSETFGETWWDEYADLVDRSNRPVLKTGKGGSRWMRAVNKLDEWAAQIPEHLESAHRQLLADCRSDRLPPPTMKKIAGARSAQELNRIIDSWQKAQGIPGLQGSRPSVAARWPEARIIAAFGSIGSPGDGRAGPSGDG